MSANSPNPYDLAASAIIEGNTEAFLTQLPHLPDIDLPNNLGHTLALLAINHDRATILQALVDKGASLNMKRTDGANPAYTATENGYHEVLKILAENGVNLDAAETTTGITPVFLAAQRGDLVALRILVKHGANLDPVCSNGATPACIAAEKGHHNVLQVLADNHADLDKALQDGRTPTFIAAQFNRHEALQVLADSGANLDKALQDGRTPTFIAAQFDRREALQVLADSGANLDTAQTDGITPVLIAAYNENHEALQVLADNGANLIMSLRLALQKEEVKTAAAIQNALLQQFRTLLTPLTTKIDTRLINYPKALGEYQTMRVLLENAAKQFYASPTPDAFEKFKTACDAVFADNKTTAIREHRAIFGEVFATIKNFLVALKKTICCEDRSHIRFFDKRTDSATIVDNLKQSIEDVNDNLNNTPM